MARKSTNFVKATYTEIIDLQTVNGKCSIIGIHTPTGAGPYNKLRGYFTQFRKFKYGGIKSMVMCPAANLPVDPLGLTGVPGTTDLMDPRDALNPILFHGCHGESMSAVLNSLFAKHSNASVVDNLLNPTVGFESESADKVDCNFDSSNAFVPGAETSYYRFLTDPKWRKFGIQSMLHLRNLRPLTWRVASTSPYLPNAGNLYTGSLGSNGNTPLGSGSALVQGGVPNAMDYADYGIKRVQMQQFTNGVTPLGWLPTQVMSADTVTEGFAPRSQLVHLPKLFMGVLVLPPSYNVEQFFRLSIRHEFLFKDFTQSLQPLFDGSQSEYSEIDTVSTTSYFNWIDYDETSKTTVVKSVSPIDNGTTLDVLDGQSATVSDSAM